MRETVSDKQREFMLAKTKYIAYGGARGGGKSWAVRKKAALLALRYPGIKVLIIRRTYPELRDNHIRPMTADLRDICKYRETDKAFDLPNGSRIKFGYCDTESDVLQYQGQEYDIICIDEATQFSKYQFDTLTACLRGVNDFPKRMYLTCNPGGVGHEWVKRLFVDRDYTAKEDESEYTFIKATVYDNKALVDADPDYVKQLEALPDDLKRAWLDGDWSVYAGQYFREFREDVHTIDPIAIPNHWKRYCALDYGLDMLAAYWISLDERGNVYVTHELYESDVIISNAARMIREYPTPQAYLAPPDLWGRSQESGKSRADIFADNGLFLTMTSNDRTAGWMAVKELLKPIEQPDGTTAPKLRIFRNCKNLIRCLPALQHDAHKPDDVAKEPHEFTHAPDALRYFAVYLTSASAPAKQKQSLDFEFQKPKFDPVKGGKYVVI